MPDSAPPPDLPERGFDRQALLSYGNYLKVPALLELQVLQSDPPHPDELQFIIVHQAYELWFKLVAFELERVRSLLFENRLDDADAGLRRVHAIERVLNQQIHVLETMTPGGFLGFRDHLRPASGFQSVQFRELEILSGLRDDDYLALIRAENIAEVNAAVDRKLREPSLRNALHAAISANGFEIGYRAEDHSFDDELLADALVKIHRDLQPRSLFRILDGLAEHDELIMLWRHHHVMMVERLIGSRRGTGGSTGAKYLRSTMKHRFFPELWRAHGALGAEDD